MRSQIFLSIDGRCRNSWRAAFPDLIVGSFATIPSEAGLIWALQPAGRQAADVVRQIRQVRQPLVLLADEPNEEQALSALAEGASGYCNGHAAPEVLVQVATVIENGGIWVGQKLLQRLLTSTARLLPDPESRPPEWQAVLTPREHETASFLAKGASNKEIARQLDITERTVKAHVGAILEKLGARDRLHLSLIINGIDKAS